MAERCSHPLVIPLLDTHTHSGAHTHTHRKHSMNTHFCHEQHVLISPMTQTTLTDRRCYMTETFLKPVACPVTSRH